MRHRRPVRKMLVVLALVAGLVAAPQAHALIAVTQPGSTASGYTSPVFVNPLGNTLTYLNLDIDIHDIRSDDPRPSSSAPFCALFPLGACPLFYSDWLGQGESGDVYGTQLLESGSYGFYCSLHPWMTGTLIVPS